MKRIVGEDVPEYTACLLHDEYDEFWTADSRTDVIDHLKIPVLFTEGWYDFYIGGMFSMWERLPEATKEKSAFVVGPWPHKTKVTDYAEYPLPGGNITPDYAVQWFNSIRNHTAYPHAECSKVNFYSIGGDFWTTDEYPYGQRETMKLYFSGDKTLSECAAVRSELSYRYDPEKRLNYFRYRGINNDIFRAKEKGSCDGVISFESDEFRRDMELYGRIRWQMKVKSDCEDTAFYLRVYFVEEGAAYNLTETITSLSHLNKDYRAGEEQLIDLELPPIGFTIRRGNRIRVDIASDGEIYVPHSNTKAHWAQVTDTKVATNTIICGGEAYIELPIKPNLESGCLLTI